VLFDVDASGSILAAAGQDGAVRAFDAATGVPWGRFDLPTSGTEGGRLTKQKV
jgi:hypothetical protein